jgi:large subunit ribosomal protein L23
MAKGLRTAEDVLLQSRFTERTTAMQDAGRYTFKVNPRASKHQIRAAVEKIFKVQVAAVNVMRVRGKMRRVRFRAGETPSWKKAIVKLKPGFTIEF